MRPFHPPGKVDRYNDRSLNIALRSAPIVASFAKVFRSLKQGKLTFGDGFSFFGFDDRGVGVMGGYTIAAYLEVVWVFLDADITAVSVDGGDRCRCRAAKRIQDNSTLTT